MTVIMQFKVANVHIAVNKEKLLVVVYTSKTHSIARKPQKIKITSNKREKTGKYAHRYFCPFKILWHFVSVRGDYKSIHDPFFVFQDNLPVTAEHIRPFVKTHHQSIEFESQPI